jgi:hypothetical protein
MDLGEKGKRIFEEDKMESQSLFGKGSAGGGLQVNLEIQCFLAVGKGDSGFDAPRSILHGIGVFAAVVVGEPTLKVL